MRHHHPKRRHTDIDVNWRAVAVLILVVLAAAVTLVRAIGGV
jgi:hypothetical protein